MPLIPNLVIIAEGKKLATSFGAKFIETSAGLQHNVDELLVGVLKQIRLRQAKSQPNEDSPFGPLGSGPGCKRQRSKSSASSLASPLHTLQVAREILG